MNDAVRRAAGQAWRFRARVEREAELRFIRLAAAIARLDEGSPVAGLMLQAAGDERRHAALCAQLAATYLTPADDAAVDAAIAPRQLAPREAVLYEVVASCCITETESVATVATLLTADALPAVREVLHAIARDEVGHGRMGWAHLAREAPRGVSFLAEHIPAMLQGGVAPDLFDAARDEPHAEELLRHGVLPRAQKREVFVGTLEGVILPGLRQFGIDDRPARAWLAAREASAHQ